MTEWNAEQYAHISELQEVMAQEVLASLSLEGSEHVLDVGCGDGRITAKIAMRVPQGTVLGVDPSQDMIAFAANRFEPTARPNLRFLVADGRQLPFHARFDRVVSFNALHWIPEQESAVRSVLASLRPGGLACLRVVPAGPRKSIEDILEDTRRTARWADYFRGFQPPYVHLEPTEYRQLAERCGFGVLAQRTVSKAWNFQSRPAFLAFGAVTFVEWTSRIPEDRRIPFAEDVLDAYRTVAADRPGEEHTFKFYQMDIVLERRRDTVGSG